jgi:hypothetical protein
MICKTTGTHAGNMRVTALAHSEASQPATLPTEISPAVNILTSQASLSGTGAMVLI